MPPERLDGAGRSPLNALVLLGALALGASAAAAQGVRVSGVTSMQAVDLRPLVDDSVPVTTTTGTGPYRLAADGRLVRCIEGEAWCRLRRSGERELVAPLVQDLRAVAWGFGEGISLVAHARMRGALGGNSSLWPRASDEFDALEFHVDIDRGPVQARVGRQWSVGGLGVYNYDGASLQVWRGRAHVQAFGGRSLVAGLSEPIAGGQLGSIDDLPPDEHGWLIGLAAATPVGTRGAVAGAWQRVIRADRAGLYSERVAANGTWRQFGATADASFAWDLSGQEVNEARLRISRPLPRRLSASLEALRYRPFFDAWTIWGAFSPVAFDEVRATTDWRSASGAVAVDVRGSRRRYHETNAGLESTPLKRDGWRAGIGGEWLADEAWLVHGDYDIDIGFGASRSDVAAGARWMPDESRWIGLTASGLQHIYEFRVGTGRVFGVRVDASTRLNAGVRLVGDAAIYRHRLTDGAVSPDWSQRRFSLRIEWNAGGDPGMTRAPGAP